ncbi:MAG: hypothetical protein U1E73_00690 [Planctomycetota bacterium]
MGSRPLFLVKLVHTLVWALFAGCILAAPVFALRRQLGVAAVLCAVVAVEVVVLVLNRRRCPLTAVAARYTDDRRANFDIWLPEWLARRNQTIFGWLYAADLALVAGCWLC